MKIGIDLDGVVFDSEKDYRVYSELYDLLELKRNSKVNERELAFQKRFKWSEEEIADFFQKYHKDILYHFYYKFYKVRQLIHLFLISLFLQPLACFVNKKPMK